MTRTSSVYLQVLALNTHFVNYTCDPALIHPDFIGAVMQKATLLDQNNNPVAGVVCIGHIRDPSGVTRDYNWSVKTNSSGFWQQGYTRDYFPTLGQYTLWVTFAGTTSYNASATGNLYVTMAKVASSFTGFTVTPTEIQVVTGVCTASARLIDAETGGGIGNTQVHLTIIDPDGYTWGVLWTTDANGYVSIEMGPNFWNKVGKTELYFDWAGNAYFEGCEEKPKVAFLQRLTWRRR